MRLRRIRRSERGPLAAILFAPTLIGAIYGMNFVDMPELHWAFGYPMALGLMLGLGVTLYIVFKAKKWM